MPDELLNTPDTDTKKHGVLFRTIDGKVAAYGRNLVSDDSGGDLAINVRIPGLKQIDHIISFNTVSPDGIYHQSIMDAIITGNVVGVTIYQVSGGGTIVLTANALGSP